MLIDTAANPSFRLQARAARVVAEDYLVNFETNRYSVPFMLIGKTVLITYRVPWKGTVPQRVRIPPGKLSLQPVAIGVSSQATPSASAARPHRVSAIRVGRAIVPRIFQAMALILRNSPRRCALFRFRATPSKAPSQQGVAERQEWRKADSTAG